MNIVARTTIAALRAHGVPELPTYDRALADACTALPPPFGRKEYAELYRSSASDSDWVALSLLTAAQSEGEGATHLWDMAACTPDAEIARQMQQHAIDEARHSRGYVTLFGLIFPDAADEELRRQLGSLSPGYNESSALIPRAGSPYAYAASVDELIQMNIAEIRTRIYHLLQRPVLLDRRYCKANQRRRVRQMLDWLLIDETRHIAYTARLIERAAQASGPDHVMDLMRERVKDFNEITEEEVAQRTVAAA
jgi:rubrerythrin